MKRFLLCTSQTLHSQIFDFACDPQPLKASVGLFHTTDLCFQSRCLMHVRHRSLAREPGHKIIWREKQRVMKKELKVRFFKNVTNKQYAFTDMYGL